MAWTNERAQNLLNKRFFCQPDNVALGVETFMDIIERQIKTDSNRLTETKLADIEIGLLLLAGLEKAYPCETK